jgi:hypothetical protein
LNARRRLVAWAGLVAAVVGCGREAGPDLAVGRVAYAEALRAPTEDGGWAACARIPPSDAQGDCFVAVVERFRAYGRCLAVPDGRWRDECLFMASEQLGRAGDVEGAARACAASGYAPQCGEHILGMYVMQHITDEVPAMVAALDRLRPLLVGPDAGGALWRAYFRTRLGRGLVVDASGCPDAGCRHAAEMEVSALTREIQRREGDVAWCAATWSPPAWATTPEVRGWVTAQRDRGCSGDLPAQAGAAAPIEPGGRPLGAP